MIFKEEKLLPLNTHYMVNTINRDKHSIKDPKRGAEGFGETESFFTPQVLVIDHHHSVITVNT